MHGLTKISRTSGVAIQSLMCIVAALALLCLLAARASAGPYVCTDCHNPNGIPPPHNAECRDTSCLDTCHTESLNNLNHLPGSGTPLTGVRTTTCSTCHNAPFDGVYHPYRINVMAGSLTIPGVVDLDQACGQCHGGGSAHLSTTGSISSGSNVLTVANPTGFTTGTRIKVAGADVAGVDWLTSVSSVNGAGVTLIGNAATTVSNAAVEVNPTRNDAPYFTKPQLAPVAAQMHRGAGLPYSVSFDATISGLQVNTRGQLGCTSACPTVQYAWDWGDGNTTPASTGSTATYTYAAGGTYVITMTVTVAASGPNNVVGTYTRSVSVTPADLPPTASATCTWTAETWTLSVLDTSTDADATGIATVVVDWGDLTTRAIGTAAGGTYTHTYAKPGTYTATLKAIDSALKASNLYSCAAVSPAAFGISGKVVKHDGTTPLASAVVQVKKGTLTVKTLYTAADGTFSTTGLAPGSYTLVTTKTGYTFPVTGPLTLGPSSSGNTIVAN